MIAGVAVGQYLGQEASPISMENPLSKYVLALGIAIAILKAGEGLLRKNQEDWIKERTKRLSDWFDSKRPLAYTTTDKGRNRILWWGFVVLWDGKLVSYGIRNHHPILTILGVVILLGWLAIFRWVTDSFEWVKVEELKFRVKILTGLRGRVHNFFLRRYQIFIAWIMLSRKSGAYIIKSIVYWLAVFPVSLVLILAVYFYGIVVMLTTLAAIDGTQLTNPFLMVGVATSLLGAVILIFFWKTLWFLFLVGLEANVVLWSAIIVILVAALSLLVRLFGQLIGATAYKGIGTWAGLLASVVAILLFLEAYWRGFK